MCVCCLYLQPLKQGVVLTQYALPIFTMVDLGDEITRHSPDFPVSTTNSYRSLRMIIFDSSVNLAMVTLLSDDGPSNMYLPLPSYKQLSSTKLYVDGSSTV